MKYVLRHGKSYIYVHFQFNCINYDRKRLLNVAELLQNNSQRGDLKAFLSRVIQS